MHMWILLQILFLADHQSYRPFFIHKYCESTIFGMTIFLPMFSYAIMLLLIRYLCFLTFRRNFPFEWIFSINNKHMLWIWQFRHRVMNNIYNLFELYFLKMLSKTLYTTVRSYMFLVSSMETNHINRHILDLPKFPQPRREARF